MDDKNEVIIIGASGHGKVILSTLLAAGRKVVGFVDDNQNLHGSFVLGYKVLGSLSLLEDKIDQAAVLAIGVNQIRKKLALKFKNLNWISVIHPTAYVHDSVILGKGTVVFAGAIIQPDSFIGNHVIINTAATIDHDCIINDYTHIAPGSHIAGHVKVDEGTLVGIGASIIPCMTIGQWSTVAAGSVVIDSISDYAQVKGIPAKIYKHLILENA